MSVKVPASRVILSPAFELETSEPFRTIKSFIYSPKSLNVTPLPALLSVDVNEDYGISVPLKSGFGMVHHCLTLHQTNPNGSDRDRRAIVIHYMPVGTKNGEGEILKHNLLLSGNNPYNL